MENLDLLGFYHATVRSTGNHPETLDALVPEFVAKLPRDILNGKPLIYRRTTNGFTLYSIGGNQVDAGGHAGGPVCREASWTAAALCRFSSRAQ